MMNSQRWSQIQELYYSALPLNQHERGELIANTCGSDTVLRDEVISLLQSDESSGDFLEKPILEVGLQILVDSSLRSAETNCAETPASDNLVGSTIDGRYQIVEKLGSGGVGDVYRARDTKILSRTVVIKVLKDSSLNRPWIVAKFQQEIEALTKIADPGVFYRVEDVLLNFRRNKKRLDRDSIPLQTLKTVAAHNDWSQSDL